MRFEEYRWVDIAVGNVDRRNHVVDIRDALALRDKGHAKENSYITVFRFPEAYRQHLADTGSVGGYAGSCYADYLPIDVDRAGNLLQAMNATKALAFTLQERFDVRSDQVRYFFSGAKGFHLLIPTPLFGDIEPSESLNGAFRAVALELADAAGEEIDRAIYDKNRLFRLPRTKHKSGLWKIELTWAELSEWTTDQVRFAARTDRDVEVKPQNLEAVPALAELFAKAAEAASVTRHRTGTRPAEDGLAGAIACTVQPFYQPGKRHDLILALSGYAAKRHVPRETMLGVVDELQASDTQIGDPDNLPTAVNDTYDRVRRGDRVKGYRELEQLMDSADLQALAAILGDKNPRPEPPAEAAPAEGDAPLFDVMLGDVLDEMGREKQQPIDATPTPWPAWNAACRGAGGSVGIARGWHVVVGARSGNGKSLLGANMAVRAIENGEHAAIVSLEMAQIEMQTRVMAIVADQPANQMDHGQHFNPETWAAGKRAMHRIYEKHGGKLYINRRPMKKLADIASAIRWLHEHEGVRWYAVDYLQLAAIGGGRAAELLDRITEVSFVVRGLAKDLRVTTIGMSQLNRETSRSNDPPTKEGLMGGSPLENDAEQVMLLDHSRIIRDANGIKSWALLDKNRHGEVIEIPTFLNTRTLGIRERLRDEEDSRVA